MVLQDVGNRLHDLRAVEHAGFDRFDVAVPQHRLELCLDELLRHGEDVVDALCVLGGDGCYH